MIAKQFIHTIAFVASLLMVFNAFSQSEKKAIREGNREYKKGEFIDSEISYRSALENNPSSFKGNFNLGDAMYKQEKFEEASKVFEDLSEVNLSPKEKAEVYHNLGNSYFKQEKYPESIEAYKNALRNVPDDLETKYNLAQAQRKLIQQQQQQNNQGEGESQKNQDKNENQENKQDKQDENKDDNKKQEQQQNQQQQNQENQQQQNQQQISPEDARRMMEALQNNEKNIQDRVKEQQAKAAKVKVEKNW
ncbi:MAG TPA: tetratricopeptide repeat protein [Tenuifilaceae bacterium]|nr:tetratricopeptide repeat protein [Tenuifilaceae bacterium]